MLEKIKKASVNDLIVFSNDQLEAFSDKDSLAVTNVKVYSSDDGEAVVVELENEFYLVVHNFESEEKTFLHQLVGEGDNSDLEEEGYKFLNEDDEFRHKIVIREDGKGHTYYPSDLGTIYNLALERNDQSEDEPGESSLCEFNSASAVLDTILIVREDDRAYIFQGMGVEGGIRVQHSRT